MSNIKYYRVEGGHDADPDPEQAGRVRLRSISEHGEGVRTEHLPFSQMLSDASGPGSFQFNRPPLPGSLVVAWTPDGAEHTGYVHVLGTPIGIDPGGSKEIPGNSALPNRFGATELLMKIPPKIKAVVESNRSGIEKNLREIEEKGHQVSFKMLQGLPGHGASWLLSGLRNSPLTQISTALDTFDNMLNSSTVGSLPGLAIGSMTDIFSLLSGDQMDELAGKLGPEVMNALQNFQMMLPSEVGVITPASGAMSAALKVNPETIVQTVLDTMQNVSGFGSLMGALQEIERGLIDPIFSGMDQLASITNMIDGGFGNFTQTIDAFGNITNTVDDVVSAAKSLLTGKMTSLLGADGGSLLTSSGTALNTLVERIPNASKVKTLSQILTDFTDDNPSKDRIRRTGNSNGRGVTAESILSTFTDRLGDALGFVPKVTSEATS